jgi:hypothetical protein
VRRLLILAVGLLLVGCNSEEPATDVYYKGGRDAFEAFVAKQGKPVVVNKWASWGRPGRPHGPEKRAPHYPVPFKHFWDPKLEVAASFNGVQAFPTTAFYDRGGELAFVHQGGYQSEEQLVEDIDRYAR